MTKPLVSLPTNLTTKQLTELLGQFPANAVVKRTDSTATVTAPDGSKVLSALKHPTRALWVVRAVQNLIVAK